MEATSVKALVSVRGVAEVQAKGSVCPGGTGRARVT